MTTLAQTELLTQVVAVLQAGAALCDGGVHRSRTRRIPEGVTGLVVARLKRSTPAEASAIQGGPIDYTTFIAIEAYGIAGTSLAADEKADELFQACTARLMADPSLGGLLLDLLPPQLSWDDDDTTERSQSAITGLFPALHRTDPLLQGMP
jgi:hypothetical protein